MLSFWDIYPYNGYMGRLELIMPIVYSEEFKKKAIALYNELLSNQGEVIIKEVEIGTIRELVRYLGISTYTLYKWKREMEKKDG